MDSLNNSQNSDTKQTQSPQTESQVRKSDRAPAPRKLLKGTHKAGKHGVQEVELSSSSQTPNPKKKKGRESEPSTPAKKQKGQKDLQLSPMQVTEVPHAGAAGGVPAAASPELPTMRYKTVDQVLAEEQHFQELEKLRKE